MVVVAFVEVEFSVVKLRMVDDPVARRPLLNVSVVEVALLGNG